jgi:N-glycosylase/DNA lyase
MEKIKQRLNDFQIFYNSSVCWHLENGTMVLKPSARTDNQRLFEELTFCLLTANTSATISMKAVDGLRDVLFTASLEDIRARLVASGYRYPNVRAEFIYLARQGFSDNLKELIESKDKFEMREYLVKNVKGLGYKEASHFLRNVGVKGLAILDKHILRSMNEKSLISDVPKSLNRKRYLECEAILREYSKRESIDFDELDLIFWSAKAGSVMK